MRRTRLDWGDSRKELNMKKNRMETRTMTGVALLTAIVVVLQLLGSFIRFGMFSISLVLVPIVIGAALYGAGAGAWLGFMFGVAVLISGDAAAFLTLSVFGTVVTVLLKGTLAGLCAGLVFRALEKKNRTLAVTLAAITAPVVNTGVFILGCLVFFMDAIGAMGVANGVENAFTFLIVGIVGMNFVFELLVNLVLAPTIVRPIAIGRKEKREAPVRTKYSAHAVGSMAVGALLVLGNRLCGTVLFQLYAAARGYTVYVDGAEAYLNQAVFDANRVSRVFAADFQQVFAFAGALLIAFGLVQFFKHLNAEPKQ